MKMNVWTRTGIAAIGLAVAWSSVGCATERDPINRVQANALAKSFFVGANLSDPSDDPEFHYRNTVVDVPYGLSGGSFQDSFLFTPAAADTNRIKWEIQESLLVARQTYERFENADGAGSRTTNNGQVVAAFPISKHFDIKRDYNPATGAENNVVAENVTDRPWYQRDYMRVDWSKNLVTDGYNVDTLSMTGIFGGVKYDPIAYDVRDPQDPDAPHFAPDQGYFDITTKAFASPETLNFDWGSIPACYALLPYITWFHPAVNCNPTEITLRLSFKKVEDTDFEPTEWDGNRGQAFGWITTQRLGFDRNYGLVDQNWHRLAMKYNIWKKSHIEGSQCGVDYWRDENGAVATYAVDGSGQFKTDAKTGLPIPDPKGKPWQSTPIGSDPKRDNDGNHTDDECEFHDAGGELLHAGAYCDTLSRKCALPLYERELKTTPWYHSETSPEDLFASSADALNQWNVAIKRAAQLGKMAEAKRVGIDTSNIMTDEQELIDDNGKTVPNVFVLCHNPPVAGQDDDACFEDVGGQKVAPHVRLGDVRYHIVNLIENPQMPSAWGVVFPSSDPLTGEAIGTTVTEWLYITDIQARYAVDLIRWSNGEISDDQIVDGSYMKEWVQASQLGTKQFKPPTLDAKEIASRIASVDPAIGAANGLSAADSATPVALRDKKAARNLAALGTSVDRDIEARRKALLGSQFETSAITPDMLTRVGLPKDMPVAGNDLAISRASILRGANPEVQKWFERTAAKAMGPKGNCVLQAGQFDSVIGLARQAAREYPLPDRKADDFPAQLQQRNENMRKWLRERMHVAVIGHEMGHQMGLEHNFAGSFDSLNYHTEYWQLRTRNGQEKACTDLTTPNEKGDTCVGPRWIDPVTDTEENGMIWKFGASSIMDYAGDLTQDTQGIGAYDRAAMRFGYGTVVDVDVDSKIDSAKGKAYLEVLDGFGGPIGYMVGGVHYSQYQDKFNPLGKCTAASGNDPLSAKCTGFQMDYVSIRDMKSVAKFGNDVLKADASTMAHFAVDPQNRVRHPYMFGTDTFADETNSTVFRFDAGADAYEQLQFLIGNYEHYYPFTHFRNGKVTFSSQSAEARSLRTMRPLKGIIKAFALEAELSPPDDLKNPARLLPHALGGADALAFMARVLTRPEPGPYVFREGKIYADREDLGEELGDSVGDFTIPVGSGDGRFLHDDYDYTQGYNWSDYQKQAGSFVDKFWAFYYLVEAYDNFTFESKDTYVDGRYRNVNFVTLYPNQVRRLLANMMQDDPQSLGPYIKAPANKGDVAHVVYLPWEKYDRNDPTTTSLEYPSDATILSPLVGWEQQKLGLFVLFMHGASTQSMDLLNQMRIFSPGGLDTVDIPLAEQIRYRDPLTGILYIARAGGQEIVNSKRGKVEKFIGARMLQYANKLATDNYVVLSTDANGEQTYQKDASGGAVCKNANCAVAEAKLRGFSANLDIARELSRYLGYGPL
jgi:hypothetical protein